MLYYQPGLGGSVDNDFFSEKTKPIPISDGLLDTHKKNLKFIPYNDIKNQRK